MRQSIGGSIAAVSYLAVQKSVATVARCDSISFISELDQASHKIMYRGLYVSQR
jgi:hypothetical protein